MWESVLVTQFLYYNKKNNKKGGIGLLSNRFTENCREQWIGNCIGEGAGNVEKWL